MLEPAAFPRDRQCPAGTAVPHPLRWHPCRARGEPSRAPSPARPPGTMLPEERRAARALPSGARCRQGRSGREEGRSLWRPDKRLFIFLPMLPAARPPRWGEEAPDNEWAQGSVTGGLCRDPAAAARPPHR